MPSELRGGVLSLERAATPAAPAAGKRLLYPKADGWYELTSAGVETKLAAGAASGAPLGTAITNASANTAYPDNTNYWKRVITTDGFPANGMLSGARVGTAHTQRLQDEATGATYARSWINGTSSWSAWALYVDAIDFDAKGDLLVGTGADAYTRQPVGADGAALTADSAAATGLGYQVSGQNPAWHGFKTWAYDPAMGSATVVSVAGTLHIVKLWPPTASMVVNAAYFWVVTAGASLTNVGVGIWSAAGALLASSVNANGATATAFQTTGLKPVTFTTPPTVTGPFYVGIWTTGTTQPAYLRTATNTDSANAGTGAAGTGSQQGTTGNRRFANANTGLTTAAPATLAAQTTAAATYWAAAS